MNKHALPGPVARIFLLTGLILNACTSFSDFPNPFATPSPTPAPTFTPSPTATLPATPLPTGVEVIERANGLKQVIDYDNQFQVILPEDWYAAVYNQEDMAEFMKQLSNPDTQMQDSIQALQELDSELIRLVAIKADRKYIAKGFATNLSIAIDEGVIANAPLEYIAGFLEEAWKQGSKAKILTPADYIKTNPQGVEVASLESEVIAPTSVVNRASIYTWLVLFKSNNKLIFINVGTLSEFVSDLRPDVERIGDSIELLDYRDQNT